MESASAFDAGHTLRLCKKGGRYYAAIDGLAVFGSGETYQAAVSELETHFRELKSFCDATGLTLATAAPGRSESAARWTPMLRKAAVVFVCIALLMVPLSYALSSALERGLAELNLKGGRNFWLAVEQSLIKSAGDGSVPSAEEQAKSLAALKVLVRRIQPYADEIRPIFGCGRVP